MNVKILVAYHKRDKLYKSDILVPIHGGRSLMREDDPDRDWFLESMIGDDTGEHISQLNKDFCELTSLYWAWKNYEALGDPDFIGLCHYRRLWYLGDLFPPKMGNVMEQLSLTRENMETLLAEYPVLLTRIYTDPTITFREFQNNFRLSETHLPELYAAYRKFETDHRFYSCNMFVTPKNLFFDYCEALFAAVFAARDYVETNGISVFPRFYGTAAEYITSFYQMNLVAKGEYPSKEIPFVFIDGTKATKV